MQTKRIGIRRWTVTACAVLLAFAALARPAAAEEFVAGVHFEVLPIPVDTADSSAIEVVEVFSYMCIHCFNFDPALEAWSAEQPEDVAFRRVPAVFGPDWALLAQAFYAAETLGVSAQVHQPLFEAIHVHRIDLRREALMAQLFNRVAAVDAEEFARIFSSFSVKSRVQQAEAQGRMYRVTGVPSLVVNGKYRVDGRMAGSNARMLEVVDYLIGVERAATGS